MFTLNSWVFTKAVHLAARPFIFHSLCIIMLTSLSSICWTEDSHYLSASEQKPMRHSTPLALLAPSTMLLFIVGLRQIPYFIFIVNSPCCPSRISFTSVKNPNQTTGVISTPNAGGIEPLTNLKRGSVGQTATLNGNSFSSAEGYHDITMRQSFTYQRRKLRCYMSNVKSKYVVDIETKIFLP